jgi:hypothetical protein
MKLLLTPTLKVSLNVVFGIRYLVNAVSEGVGDVHLEAGTVDDVAKVPEQYNAC